MELVPIIHEYAYHFHERRVAVLPDDLGLSLRLLVRVRPEVDLQREGFDTLYVLESSGAKRKQV